MNEHLLSLFEYGAWVNARLLATADALTDDQLGQTMIAGAGSIHHTLVHMLAAEVVWFARWQGHSPPALLAPHELPTLAAVRERWAALDAERHASLAALDDAALTETVRYTNTRGQAFALPRWQIILHCANHSTHHRAELAAMLTTLGHPPEPTDLLAFYLARAGQDWQPTGYVKDR